VTLVVALEAYAPRGRTLCNSFAAKELLTRETCRIDAFRCLHDGVSGVPSDRKRRTHPLVDIPRVFARFEVPEATHTARTDLVLSPGFSSKQRRDPEHLRGCSVRVCARGDPARPSRGAHAQSRGRLQRSRRLRWCVRASTGPSLPVAVPRKPQRECAPRPASRFSVSFPAPCVPVHARS
jgi:hypothetical protein